VVISPARVSAFELVIMREMVMSLSSLSEMSFCATLLRVVNKLVDIMIYIL
jgi:hypothetical protein